MAQCEMAGYTSRNEDCYRVVVKHPKSLFTRCRECSTAIGTVFAPCWPTVKLLLKISCYAFLILSFFAAFYSYWWILLLMTDCHKTPGLGLTDLRIADLVVYQDNAMATTDTPWLVNADMNITLSAWNRNTVAGCYSTYRRVIVHVDYRGQKILEQEVPLGFGLKPRRSRPVGVRVQGEHFPLKREIGSLLETELRNASGVVQLQFFFDARILQNDRKAGWVSMGCYVTASTPTNASQVRSSDLVWSLCQSTET